MIGVILNSANKLMITENFDYVKGIFRMAFKDNASAIRSKILRENRVYRWFEVYYLNEKDVKFTKKQDIELYIDEKAFANGHFHEVKKCI